MYEETRLWGDNYVTVLKKHHPRKLKSFRRTGIKDAAIKFQHLDKVFYYLFTCLIFLFVCLSKNALLKDGDDLGQVIPFYLLSKCVIEFNFVVPITGSGFLIFFLSQIFALVQEQYRQVHLRQVPIAHRANYFQTCKLPIILKTMCFQLAYPSFQPAYFRKLSQNALCTALERLCIVLPVLHVCCTTIERSNFSTQ
jgi:hypothetical protein